MVLTFDVQVEGVALPVALLIAADASVDPSSAARHTLQHQALVANYRPRCWVMVQRVALGAWNQKCIASTIKCDNFGERRRRVTLSSNSPFGYRQAICLVPNDLSSPTINLSAGSARAAIDGGTWRVDFTRRRETRGGGCGQFFNFSVLPRRDNIFRCYYVSPRRGAPLNSLETHWQRWKYHTPPLCPVHLPFSRIKRGIDKDATTMTLWSKAREDIFMEAARNIPAQKDDVCIRLK